MSHLFTKLQLCELSIRNRVWVSPMCQYSCQDGFVQDWHQVHLGSRAVGGAGLVMVEATAVCPEGRISPEDAGIWSDAHICAFQPITTFIRSQGSVPGIQLAHAGRKASTKAPWNGTGPLQASDPQRWNCVAPSSLAFEDGWSVPRELTHKDMSDIIDAFQEAALRSYKAGFEVIEIHMAHGYLLHEFLSPLSNHRTDEYGGSMQNRMRFPLDVTKAVRAVWPESLPLFVRISVTDWMEGGWDLEQSIEFSRALKNFGVNLIDCSSGGLLPNTFVPVAPSYQVMFSEAIRRQVDIATAAVGLICEPKEAESIIRSSKADAVFLGRAFLRDPYWPLHAADVLGVQYEWPKQYLRSR